MVNEHRVHINLATFCNVDCGLIVHFFGCFYPGPDVSSEPRSYNRYGLTNSKRLQDKQELLETELRLEFRCRY